ncbi:MAG TPA: diguanylate cyclase [Burkholderiaceae bacterium]|nr:diguanylate cyclase [Burkholderiaceae bacterium]
MIATQMPHTPLAFTSTTVDELCIELPTHPVGEARALALANFVDQHRQLQSDQVAPLLRQELQHCFEHGWDTAAAHCEYWLAWLEFDSANYAEAQRLFERVEHAMQRLGNEAYRLKALNGMACVAKDRGNSELALRRYREALDEAVRTNDPLTNVLRLNIGSTLVNLTQYAAAEQILRQALANGFSHPLNRAITLYTLGQSLLALGTLDEAQSMVNESIALARELGYAVTLAEALIVRASIQTQRQATSDALQSLDEAIALSQQMGNASVESEARLQRACVLSPIAPEQAQAELRLVVQLAQMTGALPQETKAWGAMAQLLRQQAQWKEAFEALERFQQLSARTAAQDVQQQIAAWEADRSAQDLREQTRVLTALGDIGRQIAASLKLEDIVLAVYKGIGALMKTDSFGLGLYDAEHDQIHYELLLEGGQRLPPVLLTHNSNSFSGWCVEHRQPLMMGDATLEYRRYLPELPQSHGTENSHRSLLFAPMIINDEVIGILSAQNRAPYAYTDRDLATLTTLAASVSVAVQNARLYASVLAAAREDELTKAMTRRYFFERASVEFQRAQREQVALSVIMVDLDRFKLLNDTWGHAFGDQVLRAFAALARSHKRPHDLFGRYGGEEFVLLLPRADLDGAMRVAQYLRQETEVLTLRCNDQPVHVTASFGIATRAANDTRIEALLARADCALYRAKAEGRNRVEAARPLTNTPFQTQKPPE